jgi:NDP-sugar pyrophosphorylase family protein
LQAVILAGGLGTRLRPLTLTVPKCMVPVHGRPFLEYELELLKSSGVDDVVLCIGHLGAKVMEHFGDGEAFGVRISYSHDGKELLGPIGALKLAEPLLEDAFFVTYGDAYPRLGYRALMDALQRSGKLGVMAVYKNEGRFGKSDVVVRDGMVTAYDKKRVLAGMKWINFGVLALRKAALGPIAVGRFCDEEEFHGGLVKQGQLAVFAVRERFYEIGSAASLREFGEFILSTVAPKQ